MYLRNTWYALARREEVGDALTPFQVLGERIVAYRKADGTPVALEDACPHRKLPLSMGRRRGDHVMCGYHGLTFDGSGTCVAAPTQDNIPPAARVRSYPLAERWGLIWIWMGEAAAADPARSEEHTSELQSHVNLVCRLLLEKKKKYQNSILQKKNIET